MLICRTHLKVKMDDVIFVHVFQPVADLCDIVDHLRLTHVVTFVCNSFKQLSTRDTTRDTATFKNLVNKLIN